jgi:hypothetical protein
MKILATLILTLITVAVIAQPQPTREIRVNVLSPKQVALPHSTVSLLKTDSTLLRTNITDSAGQVIFSDLTPATYLLRISRVGHIDQYTGRIDLVQETSYTGNVTLQEATGMLQNVTVTARRPFVQILPDKTIVNVEAGITNAGATVMEVLERSPGVTVDRNGVISLKGRPGVQVMIDGKLTQLSGTDLQNLLSGMSASQIETIELMDNPSAKYDAAGNAGIINIRTKKTKQRGFNGSATVSYGQGIYPKNNNNVVFNYRNGKFNYFFTYSLNINQYLMDLYALRTYYKADGSAEALLEQPYFTKGLNKAHTLRTGADYFLNHKTTLGVVFTGTYLTRNSEGKSTADWMNAAGEKDSTIYTNSRSDTRLKQAGFN